MSINNELKRFRELANLSVEQVSSALKARGIEKSNPKTIYGWENGHSEPSAETFLILCDIYDVDNILEVFGYKNKKKPVLTDEQEKQYSELVNLYRNSPDELQDAALAVLRSRAKSDEDQDNNAKE